MRSPIKVLIKRLITSFTGVISRTAIGRWTYQQIIDAAMNLTMTANYQNLHMRFVALNWLSQYRISTFSTKEPETLEWIDSIPEGSVLWDVGANIGLYTVYAAKKRNCRVFAFEPSVFNLELLARNIFLNDLQNQTTIVPIALCDKVGISLFKMTTTAWGGALSTFGQSFDQNGAALKSLFEYRTLGISMMDAVTLFEIPFPQFIKIDVDGIEHFILRGGDGVLNKAEGVLIEVNDNFPEQAEESAWHLKNAGLSLRKKCALGVPNQYNQWWVRGNAAPNTT